MRDWTVSVAWDASVAVTDDLLGSVAEIGGVAIGEPGRRRVETTLTIEADGPAEAVAAAVATVGAVIPGTVARTEVMTTEEHDHRLAEPAFPELVGITEIAEMLGVSRQRASALQALQTFPAPVAVLASGPIFRRADLSRFESAWDRRPGRPKLLSRADREVRPTGGEPGRGDRDAG